MHGARIRFSPDSAIDPGGGMARSERWTEQQMIEPHAVVLAPAVELIAPETEHRILRMERADRIGPALIEHAGERRSRLRLEECVLGVGSGLGSMTNSFGPTLSRLRAPSELAANNSRRVPPALEPSVIVDFGPGYGRRWADRSTRRGCPRPAYDVPRLFVIGVAGKPTAGRTGSAVLASIATPFQRLSSCQSSP